MILKFPEPFPDETFYSWIARYHDHSANGLHKFTVRRLYGESPWCAIYGLPTGLEQFCQKLLPLVIYNPEELIENHSLLPYFSSAIPAERLKVVKERMLQASNDQVHGKLGTLTSKIKNFRYLRFCPECLADDTMFMGEPYWHRTHQLPGVLVCPFHEVPTLNSKVDKQNTKHLTYASASQYAQPLLRQKKATVNQRLIAIARSSSELLKAYQPQMTTRMYRSELLETGFNQGQFINQKKLSREFLAYWQPEVLKDIGALPEAGKVNWLRRISSANDKSSNFHPLYHIVVRLFLEQLKQQPATIQPPKPKQSHPCPNSFCTEENKDSGNLVSTHRRKKSGPLHGTIACQCGFSYSCNLEAENLYTGHVISYGSIWEDKFTNFVQTGYTIPQMVEAMSVSRDVIVRKAIELGLKPHWKVKMEARPERSQNIKKRITLERKALKEYRKRHPKQSRVEIRAGMNAGYKFLYRQDKAWLLEHLPPIKQPKPKKELLNWKKRDKDYLQQVKSIVKDLLAQPGKPVKITPNTISKIMGKRNLFSKIALRKIPRTAAYLDQACDPEKYYRRRFQWAKEQLIKNGQIITRSNLIYAACFGYNLSMSQESMIQELLEENHEASYSLPKNKAP
ncbi:hypothetical protein ACH42_01600 [Endozoicomonas sp. (ex Bugula neritina AB1)]|nr:hypothetical protein ACH42_01600 [Endozoicomonas sp. (ex Bugula neritina AB1)]